ncbi:MAG: hypothetical protein AAFR58_13495 [Cyanobacteria bacterium J06627_28]
MSQDVAATNGLAQADRKVIIICGGWALLAVACFLAFAVLGAGSDWFPLVVSLLKVGSFLTAAALCWRSSRCTEILSGQVVWQAIAVGMACFALGDITVILWRSLWGMTAAVPLGSIFYGMSYLFIAIGLCQAVIPRQMSLNFPQTLGISAIGLVGVVMACWLTFQTPALKGAASSQSDQAPVISAIYTAEGAAIASASKSPAIVQTIDRRLKPITNRISLLYVAGDCVLVVMAAALLIAFWGGTYSETWKLVALAGLCLYVADMFLVYEAGQGSYRQGAFWEIFWILSAVLFGLSAGVEHGMSKRMAARSGRRQWL